MTAIVFEEVAGQAHVKGSWPLSAEIDLSLIEEGKPAGALIWSPDGRETVDILCANGQARYLRAREDWSRGIWCGDLVDCELTA